MSPTGPTELGHTVDWEIFVVNKFSSVPYDDENQKHEYFSTSNNKNEATLPVCRGNENKTTQKCNRRIFLRAKISRSTVTAKCGHEIEVLKYKVASMVSIKYLK